MLINGQWLLCDDGVVRPVIRGRVQANDGGWIVVEFLADIGADRTVLSAAVLRSLGLPLLAPDTSISGLGGKADSAIVNTKLLLTRDTGQPVIFNCQLAAAIDTAALDLSVLGRDITDLFSVIIDRPNNIICLLSQRHRYIIIQD